LCNFWVVTRGQCPFELRVYVLLNSGSFHASLDGRPGEWDYSGNSEPSKNV